MASSFTAATRPRRVRSQHASWQADVRRVREELRFLVMLIAAFAILGVAVLLGSVLAVLHLQTERRTPPWSLAALHGLLAVGGLSCLALALRGPPRGLEYGVASFGIIATSLITLAALIGIALLATRIFKTRIAGIM